MLTYGYDGALLTSQVITGTINASVNSAYDNNFRVKSLAINSQDAINFSYDNDGLLTKAGELTLNRATNNGFLTGTRLDTLNDTYSQVGCIPCTKEC